MLDGKGESTGEYKFDSAGALRALENIGRHVKVNAFKSIGDDGQPVDLNWKVTVVHCDKSVLEKNK